MYVPVVRKVAEFAEAAFPASCVQCVAGPRSVEADGAPLDRSDKD